MALLSEPLSTITASRFIYYRVSGLAEFLVDAAAAVYSYSITITYEGDDDNKKEYRGVL